LQFSQQSLGISKLSFTNIHEFSHHMRTQRYCYEHAVNFLRRSDSIVLYIVCLQ